MRTISSFQGFKNIETFPLIEALLGRRSRRFFLGAEIPDGVFAYKSASFRERCPPCSSSCICRPNTSTWTFMTSSTSLGLI